MAQQQVNCKEIIHLSGAEQFKKLVKDSNVPAIVDFFATWCPPCQKMGKVLEEQVKKSNGYRIIKIDCDDEANASICQEHKVKGIPHVYLYINKAQADNFVGFDAAKLTGFVQKCEEHIKNHPEVLQ